MLTWHLLSNIFILHIMAAVVKATWKRTIRDPGDRWATHKEVVMG